MLAKNQGSDEHRADQHHDSNVEANMESLVAGGGSKQAGSGADGAKSEVKLFHPSLGDHEEPQKNGGNDGEDSAEDPGAGAHVGGEPDSSRGSGRDHLPHGDQQENDRMDQRNDGALTVGQDGESAHAQPLM